MIESDWDGDQPKKMDCFLLKAQVSNGDLGRFCFLRPYSPSKSEAHFRSLQLGESFYPLISASTGLHEAVSISLMAVVKASQSDAAEIMLVKPETNEPYLVDAYADGDEFGGTNPRPRHNDELLSLVVSTEMPIIALGVSPEDDSDDKLGWHITVPIAFDGQVSGALGISTRQDHFDIAEAARMLFSAAVHLGLYLSRACKPDAHESKAESSAYPHKNGRLRFRCLGAFHLSVDGEPISIAQFKRLKGVTLLKYLVAHQGGPVVRGALAEVLWPGVDDAKAYANLRVILHSLRRTLEPSLKKGQVSSFITTRGDSVYLEPSVGVWVDADEFIHRARLATRLASEGRLDEALQECREALLLYRGDYLEDEPYSDWCFFERVRLKEMHLDLLRRMSDILVAREDLQGAVDICRFALEVDPSREETHRELMTLLWRNGRTDEALCQFEECYRVLGNELDVEPTPETKHLYTTILESVSSVRMRGSLPGLGKDRTASLRPPSRLQGQCPPQVCL